MAEQVEPGVKQQRCRRLAEIEQQLRARYFASLEGMRLEVLAESPIRDHPDRIEGTSCRYAPVEMPRALAEAGELVCVVAGRTDRGRIQAI
jgi:tRNA A37 methylthiotransferase MiaB